VASVPMAACTAFQLHNSRRLLEAEFATKLEGVLFVADRSPPFMRSQASRSSTSDVAMPPRAGRPPLSRPRKPELWQLLRNPSGTNSEIGVADLVRCDLLNGASGPIRYYSGLESSQYGISDGAAQSGTGVPALRGVVADVLTSAGTTDAVVANRNVVEGIRIGI
jgi:hypothetical protein